MFLELKKPSQFFKMSLSTRRSQHCSSANTVKVLPCFRTATYASPFFTRQSTILRAESCPANAGTQPRTSGSFQGRLFHPENCLVVSRNMWLILFSKIGWFLYLAIQTKKFCNSNDSKSVLIFSLALVVVNILAIL